MVKIDGDRFLADLTALRQFGATGVGVVRPSFSEVDMAARRWLAERMTQAGLNAELGGAGNVIGRSPNPGPAVLVGSHSDTQPTGGWLDGAFGVIAALEVARAVAEHPDTADLAVDVVAFVDEEATFASCLGSRSFVGDFDVETLDASSASGETLAQARDRVGLAGVQPLRLEPDRYVGFIEAHIEQGPYLEEGALDIGIVTSIVGINTWTVRFRGQQNHAGTTPMTRRRDAAKTLFELGHLLNGRFAAVASPTSVWTIGRVRVEPGAQSIVPGYAEATVQSRDGDPVVLARFDDELRRLASEVQGRTGVEIDVEYERGLTPTDMDAGLVAHLGAAAERVTSGAWQHMPSAAAHDAMIMAGHMPAAMLFVPSIGGISHDFAEDTAPENLVIGTQVLAEATVAALS